MRPVDARLARASRSATPCMLAKPACHFAVAVPVALCHAGAAAAFVPSMFAPGSAAAATAAAAAASASGFWPPPRPPHGGGSRQGVARMRAGVGLACMQLALCMSYPGDGDPRGIQAFLCSTRPICLVTKFWCFPQCMLNVCSPLARVHMHEHAQPVRAQVLATWPSFCSTQCAV